MFINIYNIQGFFLYKADKCKSLSLFLTWHVCVVFRSLHQMLIKMVCLKFWP